MKKTNLQKLKDMSHEGEKVEAAAGVYTYVVTAYDHFLSEWGVAEGLKCYTLLLCHNKAEALTAINKMRGNSFSQFNYYHLTDDKGIAYLRSKAAGRVYCLRVIDEAPLWR